MIILKFLHIRSPWQNGYAERVIVSIHRKFLNHIIDINEKRLRKLLKEYFYYYNYQRIQPGLNKEVFTDQQIFIYLFSIILSVIDFINLNTVFIVINFSLTIFEKCKYHIYRSILSLY